MTRQEATERMREILKSYDDELELDCEAIQMSIYDMSIIDELKRQRDAALDTAFAALKMRDNGETLVIGKWYREGDYRVMIKRDPGKDYNEFCVQRDEDGFTKWGKNVADSYREERDG